MTEIISFGNENASFCEDCSKIWSTCLTLPLNEPQKVCRFNKALQRRSCPSCSFFVDTSRQLDCRCVSCKYFKKMASDKRHSSNQSSLNCAEFLRTQPEWCPDEVMCLLSRSDRNPFNGLPREGSDLPDTIYVDLHAGLLDRAHYSQQFDLIHFDTADRAHSAWPKLVRVLVQPKIDGHKIKTWIRLSDELRASHKKLSISNSAEALWSSGKFRLLDIKSTTIKTFGRKEPPRYVVLSYIWGQVMRDYSKDISQYSMQGLMGSPMNAPDGVVAESSQLDLDSMPATLRDTVDVVETIGERYIWIDALCIDQADPQDMEQLFPSMDVIYSHAYLTIVAASGNDANAGIHGIGVAREPETTVSLQTKTLSISMVRPLHNFGSALMSSTWSKRGWTMQEHLLSKRCLFFFEKEMCFQSKEFEARESFDIELLNEPDRNSREISASAEAWAGSKGDIMYNSSTILLNHLQSAEDLNFDFYDRVVERYSDLDFTHLGDRLSAFQGVLSVIESIYNTPDQSTTLSGLPTRYFSSALCWRSFDGSAHRIPMNTLKSRRLPSWSWVGWTGRVWFPADYFPEKELQSTCAIVMDAANILLDLPSRSNNNPKARPAINYHSAVETPLTVILHVRGPMARCTLYVRKNTSHRTYYGLTLHGFGDMKSDIHEALSLSVEQASIIGQTTFRLVELEERALLLLSISDGIAERVALVTPHHPGRGFAPEIWDCFEDAYLPVR